MIGLSLSFCVQDILKGDVREEDVQLIISGTAMRDYAGFWRVMDSYADTYWSANPYRGTQIAWHWWTAGKIFEPRMHGGEPPNICRGHWVYATQQLNLLTRSAL